jgi:thiamine-phosphate pyrophosphorylase
MHKPLRGGRAARLPRLLFVTDPARTPDPVAVAARLSRGAGVIYRSFGADDAYEVALALAKICRRRGLVLLIGADAALARAVRADGVHLPERMLRLGARIRRSRPKWLLTGAAHSLPAIRRAAASGLDAVLVSPVFDSRSPSAGRPLGPIRFAALRRQSPLPVIALGGITLRTARRVEATGAHGVAAVEGLVENPEGLARAVRRGGQNWKAVSRWTRGRAS